MNKILHIYGQPSWHEEAIIIGDKEGLEELKKAVETALSNTEGKPGVGLATVADGEGFYVIVLMTTPSSPFQMEKLREPYTEEPAKDLRENVICPWKVAGEALKNE